MRLCAQDPLGARVITHKKKNNNNNNKKLTLLEDLLIGIKWLNRMAKVWSMVCQN